METISKEPKDQQKQLSKSPENAAYFLIKLLVNLILIISLIIYGFIYFGAKTNKYRTIPILSSSMAPTMPKNSLAIAVPIETKKLKLNDILVFQKPGEKRTLVAHRIMGIEKKEEGFAFRTKGDANAGGDPWQFTITDKKAWIVKKSFPNLGKVQSSVINLGIQHYLLYFGMFLSIIFGLQSIWLRRDKDGKLKYKPETGEKEKKLKKREKILKNVFTTFSIIALLLMISIPMAWALFTNTVATDISNPAFGTGTLSAPTSPSCTWGSSTTTLTFNWTNAGSGQQNNTQLKRATTSGGSLSVVSNYATPTATGTDAPSPVTSEWFYKLSASRTSTNWTSSDTSELRSDRCSKAIDTFAGTGTVGATGDGSAATSATVNLPRGVTSDSAGNVYFADTSNNKIRKVDTSGIITTIAGGGTTLGSTTADCNYSGSPTGTKLNAPSDVVAASNGDIYIADTTNQCIRKISGGTISRFAGTGTAGATGDGAAATSALVSSPLGLAINSTDLYISDSGNNKIRKVLLSSGVISLVAGGGATTACTFAGAATTLSMSRPRGLEFDLSGNLLIADTGRACIRKLTISGSTISQVAGGGAASAPNNTCAFAGAATSINLSSPSDIEIDTSGNIFFTQTGRHCVHKITGTNVAAIGGTGTSGSTGDNGPAAAALISTPYGLTMVNGNLIVAQNVTTANSKIRILYGV
ncbi:MAG: signal peptidase I [Acidimicrobiia bacterium]